MSSSNLLRRTLLKLTSQTKQQNLILNSILIQSSSYYSTSTKKYTPTPRKPKPEPTQSKDEEGHYESKSWSFFNQNKLNKVSWPRPSEIPWQAKVANSVNLIGKIKLPVQFKTSPDGQNCWAATVISQDSSSSAPLWIPIIFEGNLANIAASHLKENDYVYIAGSLNADPPPFTLNDNKASIHVRVHIINFVEESSQAKRSSTPHKQKAAENSDAFVDRSWKDLLLNPHEWWDIRLDKENSVGATFERKDNGKLLWIDGSTPEWIQQKLDFLTIDHKFVQKEQNAAYEKKEENSVMDWKDLTKDPKQWRDYRKKKLDGLVNPKFPDFKRKDSSISLWLNRAPGWALSELEGLEFDTQVQNSKPVKERKGSKENFWKDLVENPDKWWDNRMGKTKEKSPDFRHKDSGEGLWLNDSPAWVLPKLQPPKSKPDFPCKKDTLLS